VAAALLVPPPYHLGRHVVSSGPHSFGHPGEREIDVGQPQEHEVDDIAIVLQPDEPTREGLAGK
jgi:hypothetical protein